MWVYNENINKWEDKTEMITVDDFNFTKQELSTTRFYSKFLSGATYVPMNSLQDVYDILGKWRPRSWFISTFGSTKSKTLSPTRFATPVDKDSIFDFNVRFRSEYGLTLKNLFTPKRLIRDSLKNLIEVDYVTNVPLDLEIDYVNLYVDGQKVNKGNLILVKNQFTLETIDSTIDPETYFTSNYYENINYGSLIEYLYYNSDNGIYLYDGLRLVKQKHFDDYENCIRATIYIRSGQDYANRQFHLSRLKNGYFPTSSRNEPMEFTEKKQWLLRHRVDYNNVFDLNYYDVITEAAHQYSLGGTTYSIPERTLSVGEFGSILVHQKDVSNLAPNRHKTNLRSISKTLTHYWICGDEATLISVRKHDLDVSKVSIESLDGLKSVSFYDDNRGAVVGDLNTILLTFDGGKNWKRLRIDDFAANNYTKVIFAEYNKLYISGRNGVFIEIEETQSGWMAYKRKIVKNIDKDDSIVLNENINDMLFTTITGWTPSYNYVAGTFPDPIECLIMVTDGGSIVMCDTKKKSNFEYTYLDLDSDYGDIINISRSGHTLNFYFTNNDGLYTFDISDFTNIGVNNKYSNNCVISKSPVKISDDYANEIFDYEGTKLNIAGNNSLIKEAVYFPGGTMSESTNFYSPDPDFDSRLHPKMLFLNYDMASKLNFFTDDGVYRLPNEVSFDTNLASRKQTYTLPATQIAWWKVMKNPLDNKEHFKKITIPFDPALTRGRVKEIRVQLQISAQPSFVSVLLRRKISNTNIKVISLMRYGQQNPSSAGNVNLTFSSNTKLPSIKYEKGVLSGKTFRMDLVSPPFIISNTLKVNTDNISEIANRTNNIDEISGDYEIVVYDHQDYGVRIYGWSMDFYMEDSYLSFYPKKIAPTAPSYLEKTEYNWWSHWSENQVSFPFGPTNSLPSDYSKVQISASFSGYASYSTNYPYTLNISGDYVSNDESDISKLVPNKDSIDMFGRFSNAGEIDLSSTNAPSSMISNFGFGERPALYLWKYLAVLEVDTSWAARVGDLIRIESRTVDANALVNRIIPGSRKVSNTDYPRNFLYMYTNFNENIINELSSTTETIKITNLNTYVSIEDLLVNFNNHPLSNGYGITFSSDTGMLTLGAKFNNKTAYYNLGTLVEYDNVLATMSYADSFMNFGYSPTYNILDYLEGINESTTSPTFYAQKEYYSMPVFKGFQMLNPFVSTSVYIDGTGMTSSKFINDTGNRIAFGPDLEFEWSCLMTNTFVDLEIYQPNATTISKTFSTPRLLITNKYKVENYLDSGLTGLIIEFHKRIGYNIGNLNDSVISIASRRTLAQISEDLKFMNNIQSDNSKIVEIPNVDTATFSTFGNYLGYKINTDAYAKVLMSDADTVNALSAIFYVDHKNELAMNITKLDRAYDIEINSTLNYNGYLYINCKTKHELKNTDGIVLEFTGGTYSSQTLNQQYFGYHTVKQVINEYDFVTDVVWGNQIFVGNDIGHVRYLRKDPFLNYEPVDIIEIGSDGSSNMSVKVMPENVVLTGPTFSLVNVDFTKYRMKLVDGLTFEKISDSYPWLLEAEVSDAAIGSQGDKIIWYKGTWESGRWFDGIWYSGDWLYGDWYGGEWNSRTVTKKGLSYLVDSNTTDFSKSVWRTGRWYGGTWNNGTWANGRWYGGTWNNGRWFNGIWNEGLWNVGKFIGGIWVDGKWMDGYFSCDSEPAFWMNGEWVSGDFENGIWYNGVFGNENTISRFGVNSSNSRTSIWYGGIWKNGTFHSGPYGSIPKVSDVHKYSIWHSGHWLGGDFYGGIAYNMMFSKGNWYGGILEEIQVIGLNSSNNSLILNGIFRFNIGDEFYVIDNNINNDYSFIGSNQAPTKYKVLRTLLNETERTTEVYVDYDVEVNDLPAYRKESGEINYAIPDYTSFIASTMSVSYDVTNIKEIRVKINLTNHILGDLLINLQAPNGQVINVIDNGKFGISSIPLSTDSQGQPTLTTIWAKNPNLELVDSVFTTESVVEGAIESPMTGRYKMDKKLNRGLFSGSIPLSTTDSFDGLTNEDGGINGDWILYVRDTFLENNLFPDLSFATARYEKVGDNIRVQCVSTAGNINNVRIGDTMEFGIEGPPGNPGAAPYFTSEIIGRIGNKYNSTFILAVTSSTTPGLLGYDFVEVNTGFSSDPEKVNYGKFTKKVVGCVIKSNPKIGNVLKNWEIQFINGTEVGAQISYKRLDGIETGLRIVSDFKNVEWSSGIWTNGIFEKGNFKGGIWYNGIMKGKMN